MAAFFVFFLLSLSFFIAGGVIFSRAATPEARGEGGGLLFIGASFAVFMLMMACCACSWRFYDYSAGSSARVPTPSY